MVNSNNPRYEKARRYLTEYLAGEYPLLQKRFPKSDIAGLLGTLDDETLIDLEADRIGIDDLYQVLNRNMIRLSRSLETSEPSYVKTDQSSRKKAEVPPKPDNSSSYVDIEVEKIAEKIRHNRSSRSYRHSQVKVGQGGKNWNGTSILE